jgi:hypothetical protein
MYYRTRNNALIEQEYQDVESDLRHLTSIDLTDSEIEFLAMKRMRNKRANTYTPDPRAGEYET